MEGFKHLNGFSGQSCSLGATRATEEREADCLPVK